jgi:hypothetical protein
MSSAFLEQVLDLLREDVLAAGDDHVVVAAVDEQQAVVVEVAHIAAGHVAVDDLLGAAVGVAGERRAVAHEDPAALVAALDALIVLVVEDHLAGDRRAAGGPCALRSSAGVAMVAMAHSVEPYML